MLRPFEAYQATITRNQEHYKNPHLSYWLITNLKNKKLLLSNIWIPNLLYIENKDNLPVPQTKHNPTSTNKKALQLLVSTNLIEKEHQYNQKRNFFLKNLR
jgi:hypothetical protein